MSFIETALPDTTAWISHFEQAEVPVLARTADAIARLREKQDDLVPRAISNVVAEDPLMSLKVLVWAGKHLAQNRRATRSTLGDGIESVEAAVISTGTAAFFRKFDKLVTIETRLATVPEARLGLLRVLSRSLVAANFARDWASYRNDVHFQVIAEAAMRYEVAKILVWIFAPRLALRVQASQRSLPAAADDIQVPIEENGPSAALSALACGQR